MYRFWRFGLKLPIRAPFWGVFGEYFPHTTSPIVLTPTLSRAPSFKLKSSWFTILQGVEFSIFPLILAWVLQQCSATALPVISYP